MTTMLVTSILLAALYVGAAIWKRKSLPESISAMVYDLGRPWRWLWTVWLWTVTLLLLPSLMEALPEGCQFVGFLAAVCLMFTGAMPLVRGEKNTAHYVLAVCAGILSQVCVLLVCPWWLLAWTLMLLAWVWTTKGCSRMVFDGRGVMLAELICATTLYGTLFTNMP